MRAGRPGGRPAYITAMSERILVLVDGGRPATEVIDGREWAVTTMGGPEKGREYALVRDESGYYAVEVDDHRVGVVLSELSSFVVDLDGALHVLVAGVSDADHVDVTLPEPQSCRVKSGVWMAFPRPFMPGTRITAIYRDRDGRDLARRTTEPQ
jgi:hypothetical protein